MQKVKGPAQPPKGTVPRPPKKQGKTVSVPVAYTQVKRTAKPSVTHARNGDCRIVHREYVRDVLGSVAFSVLAFAINPGKSNVFPWLCTIANNYESYRFNYLRLVYETEASTTSTGTVMLAIDYDANDPDPIEKTDIMAYRGAVRTAPWQRMVYSSLPEELTKRKSYYVTSVVQPVDRAGNFADKLLYDIGTLFIATIGQASGATIGELYVEYDVSLMTPQMNDPSTGLAKGAEYTGTSNANPFGTKLSKSNIRVNVTSTGTTTSVTTIYFFEAYSGLMVVNVGGTGVAGPFTVATTGLMDQLFDQIGFNTQVAGAYAVTMMPNQTITLTIPNTTITDALLAFGQWQFKAA